jgi:hypothetical protein
MKIAGSGSESGSISQRHGSANTDPDPHQNVMDPQHCSQWNCETSTVKDNSCVSASLRSKMSDLYPDHDPHLSEKLQPDPRY